MHNGAVNDFITRQTDHIEQLRQRLDQECVKQVCNRECACVCVCVRVCVCVCVHIHMALFFYPKEETLMSQNKMLDEALTKQEASNKVL